MLATALTIGSIVLGLVGLQIYYWPTAVPALGAGFFLRVGRVAWGVRALVLASAAIAAWIRPTDWQIAAGLISCVLAAGVGFLHPRKALPVLTDPEHERASVATLSDDAVVFAYASASGDAVAWPIETLVPHHLVHDRAGDERVVATW